MKERKRLCAFGMHNHSVYSCSVNKWTPFISFVSFFANESMVTIIWGDKCIFLYITLFVDSIVHIENFDGPFFITHRVCSLYVEWFSHCLAFSAVEWLITYFCFNWIKTNLSHLFYVRRDDLFSNDVKPSNKVNCRYTFNLSLFIVSALWGIIFSFFILDVNKI